METETEPPGKRVKKENFFALYSTMAELKSENEYCDITIQVGNQSFKSHRYVLAALSEYFHAMFTGNFKERNIRDEPIVLHDMNADAFELILDFMYSGDVKITRCNISSLLLTADFLKLRHPYIETECTKFIHEHIWILDLIPNLMKIFEFSRVTKKTALTNITRKYICQHMAQLSRDDVFEKISYEDMKLILQPECPFWIYNQDIVLNFLVGWVHQSRKERRSCFKELLKLIDLKKISTHCIAFLLEEYEKLMSQFEDAKEADNTGSESFSPFSPSFVIDNARSEATITLAVDDFSIVIKKEGVQRFESFPCMIQNMPWRIYVHTVTEEKNKKKSLAFFVRCDGHSTIKTWSCRAKYELSVLPNYSRKSESDVFNEQTRSWGFKPFAGLDDLINSRKGFVRDDVIVFQAHITVLDAETK